MNLVEERLYVLSVLREEGHLLIGDFGLGEVAGQADLGRRLFVRDIYSTHVHAFRGFEARREAAPGMTPRERSRFLRSGD